MRSWRADPDALDLPGRQQRRPVLGACARARALGRLVLPEQIERPALAVDEVGSELAVPGLERGRPGSGVARPSPAARQSATAAHRGRTIRNRRYPIVGASVHSSTGSPGFDGPVRAIERVTRPFQLGQGKVQGGALSTYCSSSRATAAKRAAMSSRGGGCASVWRTRSSANAPSDRREAELEDAVGEHRGGGETDRGAVGDEHADQAALGAADAARRGQERARRGRASRPG